MQTEQIIQLIETVATSGLTEFEYREGDVKLVLKAKPAPAPTPPAAAPLASAELAPPAAEAALINHEHVVKSPLVGTFYSAPAEDATAYVTVGETVKKGQVLGLIETMKMMNEVECDRDGVVTAILIENEQIVEYGQPLFAIE